MNQTSESMEGQPRAPQAPREPPRQQEMPKIEPNEFDLKVLKECREESLRYRIIPISSLLFGISSLKRNPAGGLVFAPTLRGGALAALTGIMIGRLSYASVCSKKLMDEERGNIRKQLGNLRGNPFMPGTFGMAKESAAAEEQSEEGLPNKLSDDEVRSFDIDSDKNIAIKGLDPEFMPSVDKTTVLPEEDKSSTMRKTSYDELRRLNREEHERKRLAGRAPGAVPPATRDGYYNAPSGQKDTRPPPPPPVVPSKPVRRNMYGDVIEE